MTIPVPHLVGCYKMSRADPSRYACNCGADAQNERAAMLDRAEAAAHSHRVGDGSLETARAHGAFLAWCAAEVLPRDARWCAVVRAVDASRPTLTEEQAYTQAVDCLAPFASDGEKEAVQRALLRASRGELGPTKPGAQ